MTAQRWLVDAMNVIGSRPDGWWRDRRAAKVALLGQLAAWCAATGEEVTVVFDGWAPDGVEGVETISCPGGPGAADHEIARRVAGDSDPASLTVATSDRGLVARVRVSGAKTEGARQFRARLDGVAEGGRDGPAAGRDHGPAAGAADHG